MRAVYFIGEPGVGKSTLVGSWTAQWDAEHRAEERKPFAHTRYYDSAGRLEMVQLGAPHETFPGTDRLSMSVSPKAVEWLLQAPAPRIIGEGDRLASSSFFEALERTCDEGWMLVLVTASPETLAARRRHRGGRQDLTWLKGRQTKVANLAKAWEHRLVTIDNDDAGAAVTEMLQPVVGFLSLATHTY